MQAVGIAVPKMSAIVNRTTQDINGTFNGQPLVIPAGYRRVRVPRLKDGEPVVKNGEPVMDEQVVGAGPGGEPLAVMLPDYAAEMVKRQNVVMGTEDPANPRDVEYLLGCAAWGDDIDHIEQTEAVERLDRSLMDEEAQQASVSSNRHTAKLRNKKQRRARFTDERTYNPTGIKGNVG